MSEWFKMSGFSALQRLQATGGRPVDLSMETGTQQGTRSCVLISIYAAVSDLQPGNESLSFWQ